MSRDNRFATPEPMNVAVDADLTSRAPLMLVSSSATAGTPARRRIATGTYSASETSPYEEQRIRYTDTRVALRMSVAAVIVTAFGAFAAGVGTTLAIEYVVGPSPVTTAAVLVAAPAARSSAALPPAALPPAALSAAALAPAATSAASLPVAKARPTRRTVPAAATTRADEATAPAEPASADEPAAETQPKSKRAKAEPQAQEGFLDPFGE